MVVHDYGQLTPYFNNLSTSNFYITNVTLSSEMTLINTGMLTEFTSEKAHHLTRL